MDITFNVKKVAMTGGSGPIGLALIKKLLEHKVEILLLQRENPDKKDRFPKDRRLQIVNCNLEQLKDYSAYQKDYDVFFHLGWANTFHALREDIEAQYENVKYSCAAAELAHNMGCHSFIGAGSQAEYGRHMEPLGSDTVCKPENAYGVMKLCACHSTRIICQKYGMRHIWPRILSGYGPFDNPSSVLISNIINALNGRELIFSRGEQIWDFVYVDDIATALLCIAERGKNNEIYPIGSGKARPLKEYIEILCRKLGQTNAMKLGKIPYSKNQIMHLEANITKLQEDTGWVPEVDFEDGITKTIEFYKHYQNELCGFGGEK